jgi:hypothetical protein
MSFVVMGYGLLLMCEATSLGDRLLAAQDSYVFVKISLAVLGSLSALSTFAVWGLMLYDWGTCEFSNVSYKRLWFLAMTIGMFVGSWIYYFVVFEMGMNTKGKSGRSKTDQEQS